MDRTPGPATLVRIATDPLAIAAFAFAGERSHGTDPIALPWVYLDTLAPFLLGWIGVAAVAVAVGRRPLPSRDATRSIAAGLALWVPACLVGLALRSTGFFHGGVASPFPLVALGFGGVAVAVGRAAAALLLRQMSL